MTAARDGFDRRSFLVLVLQSLLLALFPWLRTEKGLQVAKEAAEIMIPGDFMDWGCWTQVARWHMVRGYTFAWSEQSPMLVREDVAALEDGWVTVLDTKHPA